MVSLKQGRMPSGAIMYNLRKISVKSLQNCEGGKLRNTIQYNANLYSAISRKRIGGLPPT